jgi:hypothetical protein
MKVPAIPELMANANDMGIHLHACSTTMDLMGVAVRLILRRDSYLGAEEGDTRDYGAVDCTIEFYFGSSCQGPNLKAIGECVLDCCTVQGVQRTTTCLVP